jgi:hypothetical protein
MMLRKRGDVMRADHEPIPTTRPLFRRIGVAIALLGLLPLFGCGPSAAERAKEDAAGKKLTQEGAQRILQEGGRPAPTQPPPTKTYEYGKGN